MNCKKSIAGKLFFLIKIFNFHKKNNLPPKNLPARLLSVVKNSAWCAYPVQVFSIKKTLINN